MNTVPVGGETSPTQYVNNKDCSQGFCTLYCPQWCYIDFPPPPPFAADEFSGEISGPNFSPLVITIICILAAAFLLVSYYAIVSKYWRRHRRQRDIAGGGDENGSLGDVRRDEPWFVATSNGLDDAVIRSIEVFEYRKTAVLSPTTYCNYDCAVCLSEFEDRDRLRLLPKCGHAFHVTCIDTWLRSHANCPLCRANVAAVVPPHSPPALLGLDVSPNGEASGHSVAENAGSVEAGIRTREILVDILDVEEGRDLRHVRRSVSMDCIYDRRILMSDVFEGVAFHNNECYNDGGGSGNGGGGGGDGDGGGREDRNMDASIRRAILYTMERSHSSERWFFSKNSTIAL
ncbi:E3 ubiquitin-protein ligase Os04g0590900-like [Andrographis paniculata]|uniref:E3 ubiquitin-protein ligase Os04g0590900-like n=1 Tax=Andrographis paniculata TaxID=175694 RepID=UPI0021E9884B|nr:E3 ubiquitin-protein ligase Os04g0590900-like [Andrographis paniculata]